MVCRQMNLERFSAHYGFPPETIAAVINDNQHIDQMHLYVTLLWWKLYDSEYAIESQWKIDPEAIQDILHDVCQQLAKRKVDKIVAMDFDAS